MQRFLSSPDQGLARPPASHFDILKLIIVDEIAPHGILATTFTSKAAAELRSRILSWGFRLIEELLKDATLPIEARRRLQKLDINQVVTGTIDSICERILRDFREAGTSPPVMVDDYVAKTLMLREGLLKNKRYEDGIRIFPGLICLIFFAPTKQLVILTTNCLLL